MERQVTTIASNTNRRTVSSRSLRFIGLATFSTLTTIALALHVPQDTQRHPNPTWSDNASRQTSAANIHQGGVIFVQRHCDRCHGSRGEGVASAGHVHGATRIASTMLGLPDFIQSVRQPVGDMPAYSAHQISDKELSDVYVFLQSVTALPEPGAPAVATVESGQRLYMSYGCSECHLSQGQGARSTQGSRIAPPQLPVSAFITYVRHPTREMPPYTRKVLSDEQLQDIYAYLQSIREPSPWKDIPLLNQ